MPATSVESFHYFCPVVQKPQWRLALLSEIQRVANTREHMSWAYKLAFLWLAVSLLLFGGGYALAQLGAMSDQDRTLMFIMLGTIIVTNAIWQAAALIFARMENLILSRQKAAPDRHRRSAGAVGSAHDQDVSPEGEDRETKGGNATPCVGSRPVCWRRLTSRYR